MYMLFKSLITFVLERILFYILINLNFSFHLGCIKLEKTRQIINKGSSFSFLSSYQITNSVLIFVSALTILFLILKKNTWLVCAGFLSNLFCRVKHGGVVDFIFVKILSLSFICNLGDIVIFAGCVWFIILCLHEVVLNN